MLKPAGVSNWVQELQLPPLICCQICRTPSFPEVKSSRCPSAFLTTLKVNRSRVAPANGFPREVHWDQPAPEEDCQICQRHPSPSKEKTSRRPSALVPTTGAPPNCILGG